MSGAPRHQGADLQGRPRIVHSQIVDLSGRKSLHRARSRATQHSSAGCCCPRRSSCSARGTGTCPGGSSGFVDLTMTSPGAPRTPGPRPLPHRDRGPASDVPLEGEGCRPPRVRSRCTPQDVTDGGRVPLPSGLRGRHASRVGACEARRTQKPAEAAAAGRSRQRPEKGRTAGAAVLPHRSGEVRALVVEGGEEHVAVASLRLGSYGPA